MSAAVAKPEMAEAPPPPAPGLGHQHEMAEPQAAPGQMKCTIRLSRSGVSAMWIFSATDQKVPQRIQLGPT